MLVGIYGCVKDTQGNNLGMPYSDDYRSVANVVCLNGTIYVVYKRSGELAAFYGWVYIEYTKTTD